MDYICKYCKKIYKTPQSRSNHYRIYHKNNSTISPQNSTISTISKIHINEFHKNIYSCNLCNKTLARIDSLKRHENICKNKKTDSIIEIIKKENEDIKKQNIELNTKFDELLKLCKIHPKTLQKINKQLINKQLINNNTHINNGVINTINIIKFGSEDISSILSKSEVLKILNMKKLSIEESGYIKNATHF